MPAPGLRYLRRRSLEAGLLGGSKNWLVLAAVLWGARGLRSALRRETGVVWRGRLEPGEALLIGSRPPARR